MEHPYIINGKVTSAEGGLLVYDIALGAMSLAPEN